MTLPEAVRGRASTTMGGTLVPIVRRRAAIAAALRRHAFVMVTIITLFFEGWVVGPPVESLGVATGRGERHSPPWRRPDIGKHSRWRPSLQCGSPNAVRKTASRS